MKRVLAFLTVVVGALAALGVLLTWYLVTYRPRGWSFGGMMGQMIGRSGPGGNSLQAVGWVPFAVVALILVAATGVGGAMYFMAYPEIKSGRVGTGRAAGEGEAGPETGWVVLMRTSKPEEKKVLEVLRAHGGSYLQKFVVKEAGLSRLKTHRIVSRLAERGVVMVERSGNTNELSLAPWARREAAGPNVSSAA